MGGKYPRPGESPSQIQPELTWTLSDLGGWGQLDLRSGGAVSWGRECVHRPRVLMCDIHMCFLASLGG